jgi:tRNA/tmRNA/rRNA uracil-C5-methylase (TrmA/RlmC/RlmD family)
MVESSRDACDAARANLAARGLTARVVEADAASYAWGATTRLVVLDPPRTGARAVAERLAASRVPHVVYVSCDPQTLGRDLAVLAPGYRARSVATFEMFPQTSHVETVVALERARGGRP